MTEFDEAQFQKEMRRQATVQTWQNMVMAEAQVRILDASGVVDVQTVAPDGTTTPMSVALVEDERAEMQKMATEAAKGLRGSATKMLKANKVDELPLIASRISALEQMQESWQRELAIHRDFCGHPDRYGGMQMDGQTPIDQAQSTAAVTVLEAKLADVEAELAFYKSSE